jgi:serine protease AprX
MGKPDQLTRSARPTNDTATEEPTTAPEEPVDITNDHLRVTIGVDQIQVSGKKPTGRNVCVAVFDSGMTHPDLTWDGNGIWNGVDFTSGSTSLTVGNRDDFGHGTAVSGLIGGDGSSSDGGMLGIAPDVYFMDMKVVGPDGTGLTSQLIQAIDWVIEHCADYNIRVANLSLGHPPIESYQDDPLCQAVERMVEAGIVTVVSAGNLGKTAEYPEIWGGITSPGNDPLVITVGAMNTQGTVSHSDDITTTYSSRGPTYPDQLFKPDLVAPGNALLCPSAPDSYLTTTFPELLVDHQYIRLSGSSMATAVVSGTVALMLEANSGLNPNLVKLILLTTAIKMQEPSMLEQGNGMVNAKTAVELAGAVDMRKQTVSDGVSPYWTLDAEYGPEEVWAGGAFAYGDQIVYGDLVQADMAGFWGDGVFWTDFLFSQEGVFWADSLFQKNGVFWTDSTFWADALAWTDGVFWTDVPFSFDGVFWTDFFGTRGVFWTDTLIISDGTETDIAAVSGD